MCARVSDLYSIVEHALSDPQSTHGWVGIEALLFETVTVPLVK